MKILRNRKTEESKNYMKLKYPRLNCVRKSIAAYFRKKGGFGMNELLGIAAALIIAAFIIIPGLRNIAQSIMTELQEWWTNTIVSKIFTAS